MIILLWTQIIINYLSKYTPHYVFVVSGDTPHYAIVVSVDTPHGDLLSVATRYTMHLSSAATRRFGTIVAYGRVSVYVCRREKELVTMKELVTILCQ